MLGRLHRVGFRLYSPGCRYARRERDEISSLHLPFHASRIGPSYPIADYSEIAQPGHICFTALFIAVQENSFSAKIGGRPLSACKCEIITPAGHRLLTWGDEDSSHGAAESRRVLSNYEEKVLERLGSS